MADLKELLFTAAARERKDGNQDPECPGSARFQAVWDVIKEAGLAKEFEDWESPGPHAAVREAAESLGWSICTHGDESGIWSELECWSPAGEDVIADIWHNGSDKSFAAALRRYADEFSPDEHAEPLIRCRGRNGVPESIRDTIEDAYAIGEMISALADAVEEAAGRAGHDGAGDWMLISVCDRDIMTEHFATEALAQQAMRREMIEAGADVSDLFNADGTPKAEGEDEGTFGFGNGCGYVNARCECDWRIVPLAGAPEGAEP